MSDFHYSNANPLGHGQLTEIETAKYVSVAIIAGIQFMGEREKWRSRMDSLRAAYAKYGQTEETALEDRRLRTDLARFAIEKAAELGDAERILEIFKDYNSGGYDFLGKVVELVEVGLRNEGPVS